MSFRRPSQLLGLMGVSSTSTTQTPTSPPTQPRLKYQTSEEARAAAGPGGSAQRKGSFTMLAQAASNFVSTIESKLKRSDNSEHALDGVVHTGPMDDEDRNIDSVNAAFAANFHNPKTKTGIALPSEFDSPELDWVEDDFPESKLRNATPGGSNDALKRAELERRVIAFLAQHDSGKPNHGFKTQRIVDWGTAFGESDVNAKLFVRFASGLQVARRAQRPRRGTGQGSFSEPSTLREQLTVFFESHDATNFALAKDELVNNAMEIATKHGMDALDKELKRKYGATVASPSMTPRVSDLKAPPNLLVPPAMSLGTSPPMSPNHVGAEALGSRKGSFFELDKNENEANPWIPPPMSPIGGSNTKPPMPGDADYCSMYKEAVTGRSFGVCLCGLSRADHKGAPSLFYVGEVPPKAGGTAGPNTAASTVLHYANAILGWKKGDPPALPNI